MAMTGYPFPQFHFSVQWGGTRLGFSEVTGLDSSVEVIEYREGTDPTFTKIKMPGLKKFNNITLKRGTIQSDGDFYTWVNADTLGDADYRTVIISLLDEDHNPVFTWKALNCFPVKYTPGELKADGNAALIESLELATEGVTLTLG